MHDIMLLDSKDKCIIANKDKEEKKRIDWGQAYEKNALIGVRPMVTKLFDHLLNKFNFLNTMLSKIKKTPIFNEDVHVINFFGWFGWG